MINQYWNKATHIGIKEELTTSEKRRVVYVNFATIIIVCYILIRAVVSISEPAYSLKLLIVAGLGSLIILLNHKGLYLIAKLAMIIFWISISCFFSYFYLGGFNSGSTLILVAALPTIFIVFDMKEKRYIFACTLYLMACISLLIFLSYYYPVVINTEINIDVTRVSVTLLSIIMITIMSWHSHASNTLYENQLIAANLDLETALSEIKTLQGILPLCSYCKNIRDDQGSWSEIESYISTHSDTQFSHGICPACLENVKKTSEFDKLP